MNIFQTIISFFKSDNIVIQPDPEQGQLWYMADDVIDRHCSPIIITVIKVVDNVVYYVSNYSKNQQEVSIENFKKQYTAKYPNMSS